MKNKQTILKTVLLFAFTILLFSCNKDVVEPTPPTLNYSNFTDSRDGKIYKTIKIGNQEWMAENLSYETESGSWFYSDATNLGVKYGHLYTWHAALQAVPAGWHLPTDAEWKQLEMLIGMSQIDADGTGGRGTIEGDKLRATSGWADNGNGTNDVGFSALPGGFRTNSGESYIESWCGYWWTATELNNMDAWFRYLATANPNVFRKSGYKSDAYSVRCVKN